VAAYSAINPLKRVPALVLDDGLDLKPAKLVVPEELRQVRRWHAELSARPSAAA
jgi:glutathione S-transferase